MKRIRKNHLSLNKNTVRVLTARHLNRAGGGATTDPTLLTCSSSNSMGAEHTCSLTCEPFVDEES